MNIEQLALAIRREWPRDKPCTVESVMEKYGRERKDVVEALKHLSLQGEGRFVPGRGSFRTRIEWGHTQSRNNEPLEPTPRALQPVYIDYPYPLNDDRNGVLRIPRDISPEEAEEFKEFASSVLASFTRKKAEGA
ncbi:MAG: hypothetical protein ACLPWS_15260 [Rhodomicrobium sp.]